VIATISGSGSGTLYILIRPSGNPAVVTVSDVVINPQSSSGTATVSAVLPSNLGIGTFTGTITVTACLNDPTCATGQIAGSPQVINATYTIPGVFASPSPLSYSIGNTTVPADLTRQLTVTGAPSQNWTASSTVPWLSVAPTGGSTSAPAQITASLIQGQLDTLTNAAHTGAITITPTSGLPLTVPVTLTVSRTQVSFVAPYVAISGTSAEVIIRGDNLDQITVTGVTFGGNSGTGVNVVSDTEVRATHPMLTAGTYPVQLQNPQGFNTSIANLVVIGPQVYAATMLSYPFAPNSLEPFGFAYDAERRALVISRRTQNLNPSALLRYQFSNSAWSGPTEVPVPGIMSLGLSVDGSHWLAGTEPTQSGVAAGIAQIRASDLVTDIMTPTNPAVGPYLGSIAPANDGIVLAPLAGSGVSVTMRFTTRNPAFTFANIDNVFGGAAASADGSRILIGSGSGNEIFAYDASSGTTSTKAITFPPVIRTAPALNRTGSRFILNDGNFNTGLVRVFDGGTFGALGDLPATTVTAVLSPDGNTAYTFDSSGKVRKFDLSGVPPGSGVPYPEAGTPGGISLAGSPGTPAFVEGLGIKMVISPDGGTLFLAGGTQIVVQPVP